MAAVTPGTTRRGRGWPPGRRASGTTRPGKRGPVAPTAGRARCGGNRCRGARSDRPASSEGPGHWPACGSGPGDSSGSPRAWAISWPSMSASFHKGLPAARPGRSDRATDRPGRKRGPRLTQGEGRSLQPGCADRPGFERMSVAGPASRSESSTWTPSSTTSVVHDAWRAASGNGGRTTTPGRSAGKAISICRPSSRTAPVTSTSARCGGRDPGNCPVEAIGSGRDLGSLDGLRPQPARSGQVRDSHGGERSPSPIASQPRQATSFSARPASRRTPASCCERMKTAVRLAPAR